MADHSVVVGSHYFKACKTVKMCKQIQPYFLISISNKVEYNIRYSIYYDIYDKKFLPTDYASLGNKKTFEIINRHLQQNLSCPYRWSSSIFGPPFVLRTLVMHMIYDIMTNTTYGIIQFLFKLP